VIGSVGGVSAEQSPQSGSEEHHMERSDRPAQAADPQELVARVRSGEYPPNWYVWPLRRGRVLRGVFGWLLYTLGGFALFVPAAFIMIPDNYTREMWVAGVSTVVLALLGMVAFGSLAYVFLDLRRWARADQYLLLMTPEDFLKLEPGRVVHVPMDNVANITLKGVRQPGYGFTGHQSVETTVLLRSLPRERAEPSPFHAPLLTFLDTRTNKVVTISKDDAFDDLRALDEILRTFVGEKVKARKEAEEEAARAESAY
jgi:hypothetical protein